ncbi:hypothetical protein ACOMHN_025528 [Nucella lapillus]
MVSRPHKLRLTWIFLAWRCSVASTFLLDDVDNDHDETLSSAFAAIRQLSSKLNDVISENQMLKAAQNSHFIWFDNSWILAFRATAGIGQPVNDAWTHVGHHDDDPMTRDTLPCGCTTVNGSLPCDRHYRSRLLDAWPSGSIDQVRLVLYENGVEKEHVTFSGTGSDYLSWFSQSRIMESSWTDLKTATGLNFFSIAGYSECGSERSELFFISQNYGGCDADAGWMTVTDDQAGCQWDTVTSPPAFIYSPSNHDMVWQGHGFHQADVMAVFVKLRSASLNEVCLN